MNLLDEIVSNTSDLCERFGVKRLCLFGSVARGEQNEESDIDFYAEFSEPSPETMVGRYFGFIEAAEERFQQPVQLLTPRMVRNPFLRRSIDRDLVVTYE
jgi:predicted nucleotidyltransferase